MQPGVAVHFKNCNAMKTKYECRASVALAALMLGLSGCIQDEILYAGTSNSDAVSENTATDSMVENNRMIRLIRMMPSILIINCSA